MNAWHFTHQEEQQRQRIGVKWVEYTYPGVRARLVGFFGSGQLWKVGVRGLRILDETDNSELPVNGNEQWTDEVCLRGSVVICYTDKVYENASQSFHKKHIIHISQVYADLVRYAQFDPGIRNVLRCLRRDEKNVYFDPTVILDDEHDSENDSENKSDVTSNRLSEVSPPSEEDDDLPPPPPDNFYESLRQMLRNYVAVINMQLQKKADANSDDLFDEFFTVVGQFEERKKIDEVDAEGEILYLISLAFCAFACESYDNANDTIVNALLLTLVQKSNDAYHYYCLSMIAVQLGQLALAEDYINKSVDTLSRMPDETIEEDITLFKDFIEQKKQRQDFSTPVVLYSPGEKETKRLSARLLQDRASQRLSLRKIQ